MSQNKDWMDVLVRHFATIARSTGPSRYSEAHLKLLLPVLARVDRKKHKSERLGYAHVSDTYSEGAFTKFFNRVGDIWNMSEPLQSPAPNDSAHKLQTIISVEAVESYNPSDLARTFQDFLVNSLDPPFSCVVKNVCSVGGGWYDVHICYSTGLPKIYELFTKIPWLKDYRTKPISDWGRRTLATVR